MRIGDDVEIGANTCIDRGALDDTVIEDGVKLDNLIQIGHNVHIGAHTAMAGCVGVAGSATHRRALHDRRRRRCILGHIDDRRPRAHLGRHAWSRARSRKPGQYSGVFPIDDNAAWEKNAAHAAPAARAARAPARAREEDSWTDDMTMDIHEILKQLPHRYPFLLVDRVLELEKGKRIKALKNVTINEPFFVGHFPHRPVMPGVLMLEALAQAAAMLAFDDARA